MKQVFISALLCFGFLVTSQAQPSASLELPPIHYVHDPIDKSFYMDEEEKICYIDLEQIPVNLRQAAIINDKGDEVVVKSLEEVPVDTIVELDYSKLPQGAYVLELRSYRSTTAKAIKL